MTTLLIVHGVHPVLGHRRFQHRPGLDKCSRNVNRASFVNSYRLENIEVAQVRCRCTGLSSAAEGISPVDCLRLTGIDLVNGVVDSRVDGVD